MVDTITIEVHAWSVHAKTGMVTDLASGFGMLLPASLADADAKAPGEAVLSHGDQKTTCPAASA